MGRKILFWEDVDVQYYLIDSVLTQLRLNGVFSKIKTMIIGELSECNRGQFALNNQDIEPFEDMIARNYCNYNFPILSKVKLGHTWEMITVPLGVKVMLNLRGDKKELVFQESATI